MMIVGDLEGWRARGRALPKDDDLFFASFHDLSSGLMALWRPDIILSSLLGEGFDVIDLARKLEEIGFAGRYRVLAPGVPQPELIRDEVAYNAPSVDFDILNLTNTPI